MTAVTHGLSPTSVGSTHRETSQQKTLRGGPRWAPRHHRTHVHQHVTNMDPQPTGVLFVFIQIANSLDRKSVV